MLEKISGLGFETLSRPDKTVLKYLEGICQTNPSPVFYEIGVGVGATTLPVAERMNNKGQILLFSREKDVLELSADLRQRGFYNINSSWGSPAKIYSGYHFELARGAADNLLPMFDLAYIDGGHVYHLDAPATCILKELCKPGGYMIFDDWYWSLATSPTMNPSTRPATAAEYDPIQIDTCHVQLVCQTIMNIDRRYEFLGLVGNSAIYRRLEKS
jgi:SAM-dependent methyltransferase